jgi:HSP90 family molecular chaperone
MVGNKVDVRSRSAYESHKDETPKLWSSEGVGTFDIGDLDDSIRQDRGTSVVIYLKDENIEYCDEKVVKRILKKYSNFVNFPIYLNGNRVNTMEAVWAKHPKDVDEKTYTAFYKFIAKAFDEPLDRLHFRADAPLEVKALFYIPSFHSEKYGMTRMEPGVSLYSRKVLIESQSPDILPDWMRFVKGVVDSEDLPLSLSREKPQDSALIAKLRKALTRKFISHLSKMAKKRSDVYKDEFYNEYNIFLKEGICQDFEFQQPLSKLLYFETNKGMNKDMVSLDEYVARCPPEQKEIYYLCAPSRSLALESPYLEAFERTGREVIFAYTAMDDFVLANLEKYEDRPLVSVEKGNIDLGSKSEEKNADDGGVRLDDKQAAEFCDWFKTTLGDKKVASCKVTNRLGASPAVVVDSESGAMRRMMRMLDTTDPGRETDTLPKQQVEINPAHPVIIGIYNIRQQEPTLAKVLAEQVFDNCLMAAGLLDDGRSMLPRLNDLMAALVKDASSELPPSSDAPEDSDTSGDSSESDSSDEESEDEENFKDEESEDEEKVKDEEAEDEEKVKDEESKDEEKVTDEESEDEEKVEDEETKDEEKVKDEESKDEEKVKEEASSK